MPVERRVLDDLIARADVLAYLVGEGLGVHEIADANPAPADLVLVRRADAARRRSDLALAAPRLAENVELAVIGQDEVCLVADAQPIADMDVQPRELLDLRKERLWIDDHAVANHAVDAVAQDPRGNQVQHELLAPD